MLNMTASVIAAYTFGERRRITISRAVAAPTRASDSVGSRPRAAAAAWATATDPVRSGGASGWRAKSLKVVMMVASTCSPLASGG